MLYYYNVLKNKITNDICKIAVKEYCGSLIDVPDDKKYLFIKNEIINI